LQSKQEEEAKKLMESTDEIKKRLAAKEVEVQEAKSTLDAKVTTIGNIVHDSVPVSDDEVIWKIYLVVVLAISFLLKY
jgi:seryl-tRNA synthetase